MASGSHVCSGTWADLAKAPTSSRMRPAVSAPLCEAKSLEAESKVPRKSSVCEWRKMKKVPSTRPTSPTTLMTNAFMPAAVSVLRRYQKLISA